MHLNSNSCQSKCSASDVTTACASRCGLSFGHPTGVRLFNDLIIKHYSRESETNLLAEDLWHPASHVSRLYFLVHLVQNRKSLSQSCHVQYAPSVQLLNDLAFLVQVFLVPFGPELLVLRPHGVLFPLLAFLLLQGHSHPKMIRTMDGNKAYESVLLRPPSIFRRI